MHATIIKAFPDQQFWDAYTELWENSTQRSVFQGPHYIRALARIYEKTLAIFVCRDGERLMGVAFFFRDGGVYKLLSEVKADYNFFTLRNDCDTEQQHTFFSLFFSEAKRLNWTLVLNYQPSWAEYLEPLEQEANKAGMFVAVSKHSICPVLKGDAPKDILDWFNGLKNYRYYVNRLKKQQQAEFEVFTGEEQLDEWLDDFRNCHIQRWLNTPTPSDFKDELYRKTTYDAFRAWAKDNVLTRFSIRIDGKRIAFNVALRQGNALVGHTQAYNLEFAKFSPGKALMYFIGEWMAGHGFNKIDFGKGGEAYKFGMTNAELELYKIFISNYSNIPFVVKSKLEKTMRANPDFIAVYRGKIKPRLQAASIRVRGGISKLF